jgi:hypothetical protein
VADQFYFHANFGVHLIIAAEKIRLSLTPYFDHNIAFTFDLGFEMVISMS